MQTIEIGQKIWASLVRPGMVVETEGGERVEVERTVEGYNTWELHRLTGRPTVIAYGETVTVKGYFNN